MKKSVLAILLTFVVLMAAFAEAPFSEPSQSTNVRYRLFPTQNTWTFLKLDTITGKIWQVQFSVKGSDYRFELLLSDIDICALNNKTRQVGRYTLYPTQNLYNFVMVDQIDGETYQVQWSMEPENRIVLPISSY